MNNKNTTFWMIGFATFGCLILAIAMVAVAFILAPAPVSNVEPIQTAMFATALAQAQAQIVPPTAVPPTTIPPTAQPTRIPEPVATGCTYQMTHNTISDFWVKVHVDGSNAQALCSAMVANGTGSPDVGIALSSDFTEQPTCTADMDGDTSIRVYSPVAEFAQTFCDGAR